MQKVKGNNMELNDFGKGRLGIHLHIKKEDLLMGLMSHVDQLKDEITIGIQNAFDEFNFNEEIKKQANDVIKEVIAGTASTYLRYGEGANIIKTAVISILKDSLQPIINKDAKS